MRTVPQIRYFAGIVEFDDTAGVLRLRGDEDRSTQASRRAALTRAIAAENDVVVDLSQLAFADTSVMVDLAMIARRLRLRGNKVLLRGCQPQITMLIELVGLHRLAGVRLEGSAAAVA